MIIFFLLLLIMPLSQHPIWGRTFAGITIFKYVGGASLLYATFHVSQRPKFPRYFASWQARLFLMLYIIACLSYYIKGLPRREEFSPFLGYTSFLLLLFITIGVVDSVGRLRWTLLVIVGSVALSSMYVLREWQNFHNLYPGFRPGWIAGDANYFSVSAVISLPIAFCLMGARRSLWERLFCFGCFVLTLLAVTLAASRGGFLGLIAAFAFVIWRSRQRLRNFVWIVLLLLSFSFGSSLSPLQRLLHPNYSDVEAESARKVAWKAGLGMVRDHPLTGIGLGNFKAIMPLYSSPGEKIDTIGHNTYVEIAAEMGIPALLTFLAILYFSHRVLNRVYHQSRVLGRRLLEQATVGIQAGLIGCSVAIFFVSGQYPKYFWLLVFLSICVPAFCLTNKKEWLTSVEARTSLEGITRGAEYRA